MRRKQYLPLLLLLIFTFGLIFQKQLTTHLKILLFITEQFPQIPVKPLGLISQSPQYKWVQFDSVNDKVATDLYIPKNSQRPHPSVILAMGVKTQEKDKVLIRHFADTMARLGYVVLWPRLETLDRGQSLPEEPETFIESFKYLQNLESVDLERISYVGFSVGSSIAFVAASDPQISEKVHALVFFGGYFDIFDYLLALYRQTSWQPHQDAVDHAKTLLAAKGVASQSAELARYSPKEFVSDFKAKIFILHDKSDTYVPYSQSIKLKEALPDDQIEAYLISDLFEHVQPNRPIKLGELLKLYGFLYQTLSVL